MSNIISKMSKDNNTNLEILKRVDVRKCYDIHKRLGRIIWINVKLLEKNLFSLWINM